MKFHAIIVAAGTGERAGVGGPKQWRSLAGKAVARWSVEAFQAAGAESVVVVVPTEGHTHAGAAFAGLLRYQLVSGGDTRTASVRAGLTALAAVADEDAILIHDAARPLLKLAHISDLLAALEQADGALPAVPVADTLKIQRDGAVATVPREGLWRAQTPQAFRAAAIRAAYAGVRDASHTDDAALVEAAGARVVLTPGDPLLMKLTYPEDFAMAEALAAERRSTRIGQGFDVHAFGPGEAVWLCGVRVDHDHGLIGHSDADVGLHALTDAILGAIGEGDIGDHFPPSDPKWKGAASEVFLRHAGALVNARGGLIENLDVTLICEAPKIKPHREAMRGQVATILDLSPDRVSVKATTTERLGFTGRGEGMAAQAVAAVSLPVL